MIIFWANRSNSALVLFQLMQLQNFQIFFLNLTENLSCVCGKATSSVTFIFTSCQNLGQNQLQILCVYVGADT